MKHASSVDSTLIPGLSHNTWRQGYNYTSFSVPSTMTSLSILAPRESVGMCLS